MNNLVFKTKGNDYNLKFPSVGEFKKIQALKELLGNGVYSKMSASSDFEITFASDMVHIEATLTVLAPQLIEDLNCGGEFDNLDVQDYISLKTDYLGQIKPWWDGCLKELGLIS